MIRNILIISNETCQYHFSVNKAICFELIFDSEKELTIPTNSPAMTVLKAISYGMHNATEQLRSVAVENLFWRFYNRIYTLPIKDITTVITKIADHDPYPEVATVTLTMYKPDQSILTEVFELRLKNSQWEIYDWIEL